MNGAQAGEAIRSLCDEFGAEREILFHEIIRYNTTKTVGNIVICVVILIAMFLALLLAQKGCDDGFFNAFLTIELVVAIGIVAFLFCEIHELIQWKLSPMGKVIDYILLRIGGA